MIEVDKTKLIEAINTVELIVRVANVEWLLK